MLVSVENWTVVIYELAFYLGIGLLAFELLKDLVKRRLNKLRSLDTLASLSTQLPFYFSEALVFAATIVVYYTAYYSITPFHIPVNPWTAALAVVAADFVYYWEHRLSHRIRLLWLAHAVHHSSPIMNTAVAFRFSIFDPVISAVSHFSLVLVGFDPMLVIFGEIVVLSYQTWIHTELVGRLGPLDGWLNTPSNHRVHHGANAKYLDRNYGGIFMVWDRLFGTYQKEEETPTYGLKEPIDTVNPIKVWFSEFPKLGRDLLRAKGMGQVLGYLFQPPGWSPTQADPTRKIQP